ncbi:MAG: cohesin domain-containing protein [Candidatus Bathyarchaeia archaeon]|jgi:hypothetical protein
MSVSKPVQVLECLTLMLFLTTSQGATVRASLTRVFIDPPSLTIDAGDSFTVNVSISNVSSLYGCEFKLYYNSTAMNGTQVAEGSFLESGGSVLFRVMNFTDHYDTAQGLAWVICTLVRSNVSVNGSGVLATMTFKSLSAGEPALLHLADVSLLDPSYSPIPYEDVDGTITVIPEFPPLVPALTLIAASIPIVLVRKRTTRKV